MFLVGGLRGDISFAGLTPPTPYQYCERIYARALQRYEFRSKLGSDEKAHAYIDCLLDTPKIQRMRGDYMLNTTYQILVDLQKNIRFSEELQMLGLGPDDVPTKTALSDCVKKSAEMHAFALDQAAAVYDLKMIYDPYQRKWFARDNSKTPSQNVRAYGDDRVGFLAKQVKDPAHPEYRVFAIAGTQPAGTDILTDLELGKSQAWSPAFFKMVKDAVNYIKAGGKVMFTGHSLGGALAEAAAYLTEFQLFRDDLSIDRRRGKVAVTSWNGFGGKEVVRKLGLPIYEDIAGEINSVVYRNEKDIVSKIGQPFGEVRVIADPNYKPTMAERALALVYSEKEIRDRPRNVMEAVGAHFIVRVKENTNGGKPENLMQTRRQTTSNDVDAAVFMSKMVGSKISDLLWDRIGKEQQPGQTYVNFE
ncbi:hypothetical protein K2X30_09875 [bacterium]|jgi:hypothetical protein|nr:hypothetical protein [bacterium]